MEKSHSRQSNHIASNLTRKAFNLNYLKSINLYHKQNIILPPNTKIRSVQIEKPLKVAWTHHLFRPNTMKRPEFVRSKMTANTKSTPNEQQTVEN